MKPGFIVLMMDQKTVDEFSENCYETTWGQLFKKWCQMQTHGFNGSIPI